MAVNESNVNAICIFIYVRLYALYTVCYTVLFAISLAMFPSTLL